MVQQHLCIWDDYEWWVCKLEGCDYKTKVDAGAYAHSAAPLSGPVFQFARVIPEED